MFTTHTPRQTHENAPTSPCNHGKENTRARSADAPQAIVSGIRAISQRKDTHMEKTYHCYTVTDDGRIFSKIGRELLQRTGYKGYKLVSIHYENGTSVGIFVHRLVALLFVANPCPDQFREVNHIDGNTANNRADNLEWCDCAHNMADRMARRKKQGLPWCTVRSESRTGEARPVKYDGVVYPSLRSMARHFNVCPQTILEATRRGSWRKKPISRLSGGWEGTTERGAA